MPSSPVTSFHRTLASTVLRNLFVATLLVLSVFAMRAVIGDVVVPAPAAAAPGSLKTPEAIELLGKHDCWTTEAPADMQGVLPGHVVVVIDGDARLGGERMVGKALDQTFGDAEYGITVVGFCR
jgi:hypothetical protein